MNVFSDLDAANGNSHYRYQQQQEIMGLRTYKNNVPVWTGWSARIPDPSFQCTYHGAFHFTHIICHAAPWYRPFFFCEEPGSEAGVFYCTGLHADDFTILFFSADLKYKDGTGKRFFNKNKGEHQGAEIIYPVWPAFPLFCMEVSSQHWIYCMAGFERCPCDGTAINTFRIKDFQRSVVKKRRHCADRNNGKRYWAKV